jgi:hypothetical protein
MRPILYGQPIPHIAIINRELGCIPKFEGTKMEKATGDSDSDSDPDADFGHQFFIGVGIGIGIGFGIGVSSFSFYLEACEPLTRSRR